MATCNDPALSREVYNGDATEHPPYKIMRLIQPLSQQLKVLLSIANMQNHFQKHLDWHSFMNFYS